MRWRGRTRSRLPDPSSPSHHPAGCGLLGGGRGREGLACWRALTQRAVAGWDGRPSHPGKGARERFLGEQQATHQPEPSRHSGPMPEGESGGFARSEVGRTGILTTSTTTAGTISTQDGCCSGVDLRGNGEWEANICTFSETLRFMRSD